MPVLGKILIIWGILLPLIVSVSSVLRLKGIDAADQHDYWAVMFQGSRSPIRLIGWSAMRPRTSRR